LPIASSARSINRKQPNAMKNRPKPSRPMPISAVCPSADVSGHDEHSRAGVLGTLARAQRTYFLVPTLESCRRLSDAAISIICFSPGFTESDTAPACGRDDPGPEPSTHSLTHFLRGPLWAC
jgi:hypothetical protein